MDAGHDPSHPSLWRRTLDAIGEAVIATDLDGTVTLWNAAAEELYGWPADEAVGANIVDLTPSSASREQAKDIMAQLTRGQTWRGRFEVQRRDGSTFPALVTDAPLLDDAGQLVGIIGVSADLSEQLEAEALARRGRLQVTVAQLARTALDVRSLDVLFDRAAVIVAETLRTPVVCVGEFVRFGTQTILRAGVGVHPDIIGATVVPPHRPPAGVGAAAIGIGDRVDASGVLTDRPIQAGVTAVVGGRTGDFGLIGAYDTEHRSYGSDQVAFVESVAGVLAGAVARNGVEEELRRLARHLAGERRRYRELFDLAPDPYLVTDPQGVIIEANKRAQALLNVERPEGTALAEYVTGQNAAWHQMLRAEPARPTDWDIALSPRNRPPLIVHASVARATAADGAPVLRWVLHDVTATRRSRVALQEAFTRTREDVTRMQDVDQWKNAMLSAAAHDLRSPLSAIMVAAAAALEPGRLDADVNARLWQDVRGHARRAETLLSNLLDLDRLTRGVVRAERARRWLDELVGDALDATDVTDHPVTRDLPRVCASVDPTQIRQVVTNLVRNAAQHTPGGTPITVTIRRDGDAAVVTVDDEGPGVPDHTEDIFAPFVTAARHSADVPSTGIGLSLVKLFVELHDGTVRADDRPGGGARFTVTLPACVDTAATEADRAAGNDGVDDRAS